MTETFYEEDEPVADVIAAFENGEQGLTSEHSITVRHCQSALICVCSCGWAAWEDSVGYAPTLEHVRKVHDEHIALPDENKCPTCDPGDPGYINVIDGSGNWAKDCPTCNGPLRPIRRTT